MYKLNLLKCLKTLFFLFLIFISLKVNAQNLKNTEWTQIKVERKDGSRIIGSSSFQIENAIIKYYFREDKVLITNNNLYMYELPYSINNRILSMGANVQYKIESLQDDKLVLVQVGNSGAPDDKINRYYFMKKTGVYEYLIENNKLDIVGDSLIEYNIHFSPTYYGNLTDVINSAISPPKEDKTLLGSFVIDTEGKIKQIQFEPNKKFSSKQLEKFETAIESTSGHWALPLTPKPYSYRIYFGISFTYFKPLYSKSFYFLSKNFDRPEMKKLTIDQQNEANLHFNKGNDFASSGNYTNAIEQYSKCLKIDSLHLDALYNLGYCYLKSGQKSLACETYNKLKIYGQKQGEYLYKENCK